MNEGNKHLVCSAEHAGALDTPLRKLGNNPRKILSPYIKPGMELMDFGCGPGFFSMEMASLSGSNGKVIAVDLQKGMLNKIEKKLKQHPEIHNIRTHQCLSESINLKQERFDFILAFYVIHEIPNKAKLFKELKNLLKADGKILIAEPCFHVNRKSFTLMTEELLEAGFKIIETPRYFFSRAIVITHSL